MCPEILISKNIKCIFIKRKKTGSKSLRYEKLERFLINRPKSVLRRGPKGLLKKNRVMNRSDCVVIKK